MGYWLLGGLFLLIVSAVSLYTYSLVSIRADTIRRHHANDGSKVDQYRFDNPAAVPMRITGFDKPR